MGVESAGNRIWLEIVTRGGTMNGRQHKTYRRIFLNRSPAGVSSTRIPPDRVSPADILCGLSTVAAPSFSMMSTAAWTRPMTMIVVNP
jgi:hypothetical protein